MENRIWKRGEFLRYTQRIYSIVIIEKYIINWRVGRKFKFNFNWCISINIYVYLNLILDIIIIHNLDKWVLNLKVS